MPLEMSLAFTGNFYIESYLYIIEHITFASNLWVLSIDMIS